MKTAFSVVVLVAAWVAGAVLVAGDTFTNTKTGETLQGKFIARSSYDGKPTILVTLGDGTTRTLRLTNGGRWKPNRWRKRPLRGKVRRLRMTTRGKNLPITNHWMLLSNNVP